MKHYCIFLLLLIACTSDDSNISCGSECVELTGRVVTNDGEPISGLEVLFQFREWEGGFLGIRPRRTIASGKTNSEGEYSIKGLINDEELGDQDLGRFDHILRLKDLDYNIYSVSRNEAADPPVNYHINNIYEKIYRKDTLISTSYFIPKATKIQIRLTDFLPQSDRDYFSAGVTIAHTPDNFQFQPELEGKINSGRPGNCVLRANENHPADSTFTVDAIAGLYNVVILRRRMNQESLEVERDTIFVPLENNIIKSYSY